MLARKINTVLLANSGCPPFLGAEYGRNDEEKNACKRRIEAILNIIVQKKDIKTVFIFSRGPLYITGKYFAEEEEKEKGWDLSAALISMQKFSTLLCKIRSIDCVRPERTFITSRRIRKLRRSPMRVSRGPSGSHTKVVTLIWRLCKPVKNSTWRTSESYRMSPWSTRCLRFALNMCARFSETGSSCMRIIHTCHWRAAGFRPMRF